MIIDQDEEYWEAQREYENKHKEKLKKYRKSNEGKEMIKKTVRRNQLKKNYGITPEQYDELFVKQKGCCAICGRHQTEFKIRLSVDHDHATNKVRGLLCYSCNSGLGHFHDNPEILQKAIEYLKQYS